MATTRPELHGAGDGDKVAFGVERLPVPPRVAPDPLLELRLVLLAMGQETHRHLNSLQFGLTAALT